MLLAETYLGHRDDPSLADRLAASAENEADADGPSVYRVVLSDTERRRSRVRTRTTDGTDLGIVVGRDLSDGDVLETDAGTPVMVELAGTAALVLTLGDDVARTAALALGHALGNRHLNLAVRGDEILVAVTDSRDRLEEIIDDHLTDASLRYETVSPTTFDDGGAAPHDHAHSHGSDEHTPSHSHDGDGHSHSHESRPRPFGRPHSDTDTDTDADANADRDADGAKGTPANGTTDNEEREGR
ncbi:MULTISPECIES: urease accessory protein UreE [unclassified Haloferax]|uniref:urease accessory protein UreE n=1 Tax=unclassified Haloferax TaxID=2625095 RepID=UPI0002AFECB5|nr:MULTISPECIES: urease accessory protein UreE [unclassified Haloferax]ELZ61164.1 urease accessory protein UreE [Haloferax sp. ATCC BAA-645]ELZ61759.1 urease accessory protein UreE [Haloferax sp. ATCC BAA-646]ELZ71515.1 urease accessory protein UreE [Haloferax sp. ATCC BAA-644]